MPKTLVTGGTGFVGSAVARLLSERGDELRLTTRRRSRVDHLADLDYEAVECDVLDSPAVRRAMRGVDRVFHAAGLVSVRPDDSDRLFDVNVGGTRVVLEEALRAGVERVVYTSSVAAIGPAELRETADERQLFTAGHPAIPYVNSRHEAEVEAMRLASQGVKLASQWWTYRNTKAKRELGWTTSPHEDTVEATVKWHLEREADRLARSRRTQPVQWKLAAGAVRAVEGAAGAVGRLWPLEA